MPDLRQALKDFVATSNSGKYADEETLMSKFPELKGYDIQTLKDFVATSNSGKYADENELFSKFPEFNTGIVPSKKKSVRSLLLKKPMWNLLRNLLSKILRWVQINRRKLRVRIL